MTRAIGIWRPWSHPPVSPRVERLGPRLRRVFALAAGVVAALLAWKLIAVDSKVLAGAAGVLSNHLWTAAACAALGQAYVFLRAVLLARASRDAGVPLTNLRAWSIFVQGVAVEAITWPGKAWADAYRLTQMPSSPLRSRLAAIASFRVATIGAGLSIGCIAGAIEFGAETICIAAAIAALSIWATARRRSSARINLPSRGLVHGSLACAGSCVDIAAASLAAWSLAGVPPEHFAPWYALIALGGAATGVPLGLGVVDGALALVLIERFGVARPEAIASVLLYRTTGPFTTAACGLIAWLAHHGPAGLRSIRAS